jgi:polysaccharide biosynthesis transport protein
MGGIMHDAGKEAGARPGGQALVAAWPARGVPEKYGAYGPGGGYAPHQDEGGDLGASLRHYIYIVLKRKWLILSLALLFVALGGVRTFLKTPLYLATARIQIEREPVKIVEGGATSPSDTNSSDFLRTQYELLKSRAMAERIVSALHLETDLDFFRPRDFSLLGMISGARPKISPQASIAVDIVASNLSVSPVPGSRVVDLSYLDPSPARAQQIADAYAEAYIASNLDKRFQANSYAKTFLDDQIKQLKIKLEESEKAQLDFAEREKMVELNDKASIAENNLAAANAALGQLVSERIKHEQLWRQVEAATGINLPQLLTNSVIEVLRGQRKALETEYQEKLENFKPSYPAMVQISNKIKEVDRQLAAEVKTVRNSFKAAYESSLGQENEMKVRIDTLRTEVLELQKKGIQYNILKRETETNRGLYNSLLQRYKEVDIAGGVGTNNIFIVDKAGMPGAPAEPNLMRALLLFGVIGLAVGGGAALLLETLDDRVRAPEEIERLTGLATLGVIPRADSGEDCAEALHDPRSAISEAYRSLATALQFSTESGLPSSIAVTSSGPGEGKSTTVIAIARYFAQMGLKVLVVDADLRRPSLHTKLDLDNSIGFSNYLTGKAMPPEVVQKTDHPNLAFMGSGPLPPNAADLLGSPRVYSLVSLGSEVFDLILFDSPPLLDLADAQLLSSAVAATIFVVAAGERQKGLLRGSLRRLQLARTTLIGAVLTKFNAKAAGYGYGYGLQYGYGYGNGSHPYASALPSGTRSGGSKVSRERLSGPGGR